MRKRRRVIVIVGMFLDGAQTLHSLRHLFLLVLLLRPFLPLLLLVDLLFDFLYFFFDLLCVKVSAFG